jgi:hypothetical protein
MLRCLAAAAILATLGASSATAGEQLLTARVEKIVLRPSGSDGCPPPCPPLKPGERAGASICVSNMGGCQTTDIKVQDVFMGDARPGSTMTIESRTGEWGGTTFPNSHALILVNLSDNSRRWAETSEHDGKLYFKAARLINVAGVPMEALQGDAQGMVSLDELLARLRR